MRKAIKLALIIFLIGFSYHFLQKEYSCENCKGNKPTITNVGSDQVVTLPIDSISLNGTGSKDTYSTPSSFLWTKISGPASFSKNIVTARGVKNHVLLYPVCRFNMRRLILSEPSDIFL